MVGMGEEDVTSSAISKTLHITLQSDLKWDSQVQRMISRFSHRLYILCSLTRNGVPIADLILIYTMYICPLLEFAAPVWSSSLTAEQSQSIEQVQRRALRFITLPETSHDADLL